MIEVRDSRADIEAKSGIPTPNPHPYTGIAAGMALWNEAHRLPHLLDVLQPWFERIVIVVQESSDETLDIAQSRARPGDEVVTDVHRGTGDASMPRLLRHMGVPWSFIVAGDELPDEELLGSLWHAVWWADEHQVEGLWLPFESTIEDVPYLEAHGSLRLFHTRLGWPETMHSRPVADREAGWPFGRIAHRRSLDEMMVDYLRYFEAGKGQPMWVDHNRRMMHDACVGVATVKGWLWVQSFPWWPAVKAIAFPEAE